MHIHEARLSHLPALVALAERFHVEIGGPYPFKIDRVRAFLSQAITSAEFLTLLAGESPCGFLIARAGTNYLTGERMAEEVAMFVEPASRSAGLAAALISEFEAWAMSTGCSVVKLTSQHSARPEAVARLYRRSGYAAAETAFIKRL
ncbi:GNAT family N-acetyltransferase [Rhizobium grahamii]|uniref:N-acetyltransferase GCN5 n=1 Tax=Rhizobium grahamii CCGE 502 TaxID=990285 RepID=S3HLQ9_9HYPH|nr:GNAT family N-acetyltransferase [Rhizobium grahamii]EPE99539.1 N-acetyltransferase GCN5 [Rhizobium grahamii CCGE 502]